MVGIYKDLNRTGTFKILAKDLPGYPTSWTTSLGVLIGPPSMSNVTIIVTLNSAIANEMMFPYIRSTPKRYNSSKHCGCIYASWQVISLIFNKALDYIVKTRDIDHTVKTQTTSTSHQAWGQLLLKVIYYNYNYFVLALLQLQLLLKITIPITITITFEM